MRSSAVGLVLRDLLRLEWRRKRAGEDAMLFSLVISWLLVAALLGYGVIETLITAVKIFTQ